MQEKEVNIKYAVAKQHQLLQQLPQFRIIKRGARQKGVERFYQSKDKKTSVTIRMFKELDIADQDLLLAILAIALPISRGNVINAESKEITLSLWKKLEIEGVFTNQETISIETTYYELAKELGKKSGGSFNRWLKKSLDRLSLTNIEIDTQEYMGSSNFISYLINKNTKKINIAINPISALVLLGDKNGYILHNRKERLTLKSVPARALFAILVGLVNIHQNRTLSTSMLIEKMHFIDFGEATTQQRKNLKKSFKLALNEISELKNWQIIDNKNDTITVKRT